MNRRASQQLLTSNNGGGKGSLLMEACSVDAQSYGVSVYMLKTGGGGGIPQK